MTKMSYQDEHSTVHHSLNFDHLWFSVLDSIPCQKKGIEGVSWTNPWVQVLKRQMYQLSTMIRLGSLLGSTSLSNHEFLALVYNTRPEFPPIELALNLINHCWLYPKTFMLLLQEWACLAGQVVSMVHSGVRTICAVFSLSASLTPCGISTVAIKGEISSSVPAWFLQVLWPYCESYHLVVGSQVKGQ